MEFKVYTTKEVADLLQVNVQTVRKWIREKKLSALRLGKSEYRITSQDIANFLGNNKTPVS